MQVTSDVWHRHMQATGRTVDPTVVFTTEATNMVKEQLAFVAENSERKYPFKFDFVTNTRDITPDSGFMKDISKLRVSICCPSKRCQWLSNAFVLSRGIPFTVWSSKGESDADEVMLSAVSSLKAQLLPRVSIGNCCSNFHVMLNDFLSEGCGAASDNTFMCLQEYDDPLLHVCCGWHHECMEKKKALLLNSSLAAK